MTEDDLPYWVETSSAHSSNWGTRTCDCGWESTGWESVTEEAWYEHFNEVHSVDGGGGSMNGRTEWGTDTGFHVVQWPSEEAAWRAAALVPEHTVVSRYVIEGDWEPAWPGE